MSGRIKSGWKCGKCSVGNPDGIPPKRVPMVSTGKRNTQTTAVPANNATMYPGMRLK